MFVLFLCMTNYENNIHNWIKSNSSAISWFRFLAPFLCNIIKCDWILCKLNQTHEDWMKHSFHTVFINSSLVHWHVVTYFYSHRSWSLRKNSLSLSRNWCVHCTLTPKIAEDEINEMQEKTKSYQHTLCFQ